MSGIVRQLSRGAHLRPDPGAGIGLVKFLFRQRVPERGFLFIGTVLFVISKLLPIAGRSL